MDNENEMNEIAVSDLGNPLYNIMFNEGLEHVAGLIETGREAALKSPEKFVDTLLVLIDSAKEPVNFKIGFFDAIKNDPFMDLANKEYWLSQQGKSTKATQ